MSHRKYIQFLLYFNSQPHEEADGESFVTDICVGSISTHSLTRRLTEIQNLPEEAKTFQLTASRGG